MTEEINFNANEEKQNRKVVKPKPRVQKEKSVKPETQKIAPVKQEENVIKEVKGKGKVKITFLGGVGEIGKNMTAFETDNEMIVVDAGMTFPGEELPGVDAVVPDISYLIANKKKLKAIILTHGHEDHIGALPFVLSDLNVPIYGTRLTLALVENKLREYPKIKAKMVTVKPKNVLRLGDFTIEFIKVSHSIAGSLALCIGTPAGNIIHTGDFKIDFQPIDGEMTDLIRFGELGKHGVSLLMCESTNVCRKGYSMSESNVGKELENIIKAHPDNRLIVATFASNVHRLQQIMNLAEKYKRKIAFTGRSMVNVSEVALKIGELFFDRNNIIDIDKIDKYADSELLILTTGSQGEPMSALTRMAAGEFNKVQIGENDCIIISASPIPGNEKSVYSVINHLFKKGADVIYDELADVHASGHACQEEIKTIHALTKPKFFMPIHGEYRHLKQHKELAMSMGMNARDIILPDLGMQVELTQNYIKQLGFTKAGIRLVDGIGVGDLESSVLRERKQLSEDGFAIAVINVSGTGDVIGDPFVITRGVVYNDEADSFVSDLKTNLQVFMKSLDVENTEPSLLKNEVRKYMSNFIFKRTKRRPMTLAIVLVD
ncbi:MAG TPA: ribonuclease J [Candidatus Caccopulliclostridium gallistercoris]|uniref:Ribonuclease J n=1 Tax=Candidatus Caccopulliclostridium gallistercoris TaxID=2840719 RepID=A0A9D1SYA3_9FIRM|nr:ribonuclease J [Candidatus Caccopulliclostridium gallistercoris]